ncbi:MAG: hypothetical protein LBP92_00075 [Deltaproteobacteria bacterium]|nr:hypothetical protein [Deltaproteobacteria bacterium]
MTQGPFGMRPVIPPGPTGTVRQGPAWPTRAGLPVDPPALKAAKAALARRADRIQGPHGTSGDDSQGRGFPGLAPGIGTEALSA